MRPYNLWIIKNMRIIYSDILVRFEPCNVLTDDIELEVDAGADFDVAEVGVFKGVGDDGNAE